MDGAREALQALGLFASDRIEERPWGLWVDWFRSEEATLKCMVIRPGARMSLQRHRHRQEVWRVIAGRGEDQGPKPPRALLPGRTVVVGSGEVHRIANTGSEPLVVVELQLGHCDEGDIERLADDYARAKDKAGDGRSA
ncbi:MAG TPA: phosphomannose isomerase type II C-terminal cupin domain [Candidatus Thermoplasmatota archaeon]|nr:phosphomannose isomerase type II C-terminal cupin domain [Candidatus Thermoplasmatota archaeon]